MQTEQRIIGRFILLIYLQRTLKALQTEKRRFNKSKPIKTAAERHVLQDQRWKKV